MASRNQSAGAIEIEGLKIERMLVEVEGESPLIMHRWSDKAKRMMWDKQQKAAPKGKEIRNPQQEVEDALYRDEAGHPAMPSTAFKSAMVEACAQFGRTITQCGDLIRWLEFEVVFHDPRSGGEEVKTTRVFIAQGKRQMLRAISDESSVGNEDQSDDDGGYVPSFVASNDSASRIIRILIKEEIPQPDVGVLQNSPCKFTFMPTPVVMENRVLSRNYTAQLLTDIERLVNWYRDYCELAGEGRPVLEQVLDELADLRLRWGDHLK